MNGRIKKIRTELKLSQDEFGKRLGVTRGAITNIELNKTTPKPLFIDLICREFGVNEKWLKTGEGDMFSHPSYEDEVSEIVHKVLKDQTEFSRRLISVLSELSPQELTLLDKMAQRLAEKYGVQTSPADQSPKTVPEAEEEYIKSVSNSAPKKKFSASTITNDKQENEKQA